MQYWSVSEEVSTHSSCTCWSKTRHEINSYIVCHANEAQKWCYICTHFKWQKFYTALEKELNDQQDTTGTLGDRNACSGWVRAL